MVGGLVVKKDVLVVQELVKAGYSNSPVWDNVSLELEATACLSFVEGELEWPCAVWPC